MQGITAHYLATNAFAIGTHSTVLVHSAAGGVGRLLTQIAHHLGATVIGTASTAEKRRIAVDNGADHAIDYANFAATSPTSPKVAVWMWCMTASAETPSRTA